MFGAAPLSALNNIESQVLRNARDLELCQMVLTFAYSTVQMLQMATKTDNLKTKKNIVLSRDTVIRTCCRLLVFNSTEPLYKCEP